MGGHWVDREMGGHWVDREMGGHFNSPTQSELLTLSDATAAS
jgi:hypothetical protein